jgi:hypothetical protein
MGMWEVTSTLAIVLFCALLLLLPKRNAVRVARYGIDPGLLGLKTVPGKLYFLINGHKVVETRYKQVRSRANLVGSKLYANLVSLNYQAKGEPYYLQATNVDRLILPPKYLPELRLYSSSILSGSIASVQNTLGEYSGVNIILKDRQSHDICKTRLTKSLRMQSRRSVT